MRFFTTLRFVQNDANSVYLQQSDCAIGGALFATKQSYSINLRRLSGLDCFPLLFRFVLQRKTKQNGRGRNDTVRGTNAKVLIKQDLFFEERVPRGKSFGLFCVAAGEVFHGIVLHKVQKDGTGDQNADDRKDKKQQRNQHF